MPCLTQARDVCRYPVMLLPPDWAPEFHRSTSPVRTGSQQEGPLRASTSGSPDAAADARHSRVNMPARIKRQPTGQRQQAEALAREVRSSNFGEVLRSGGAGGGGAHSLRKARSSAGVWVRDGAGLWGSIHDIFVWRLHCRVVQPWGIKNLHLIMWVQKRGCQGGQRGLPS